MASLEEPKRKINYLEDNYEIVKMELKNKVSNSELYTQLKTKA